MSYNKFNPNYEISIEDQYANAISGPLRDVEDLKIDLLGSNTSLLRITRTVVNYMGDEQWSVTSEMTDSVVMQFPLNEVETFPGTTTDTSEPTNNSISLFDILPIKAFIKYGTKYKNTATAIKRGDILVKVLLDNYSNKIPMIFRVEKTISTFMGRNLIRDRLELSMARGTLEPDIQAAVDSYISNYGNTSYLYSIPNSGYVGTVSGVLIQFDSAIDANSVSQGIIFGSGIPSSYIPNLLWSFTDSGNSGILYTWNSGTVFPPNDYSFNITQNLLSNYQLPFSGLVTVPFTAL